MRDLVSVLIPNLFKPVQPLDDGVDPDLQQAPIPFPVQIGVPVVFYPE